MNHAHEGSSLALPELLSRVDLNLLVALDALARERSVTRAAQRLGVTQSAVSHALRRLRALFGDPLLVRGRDGMLLTPRAEALVVPLRSGLATLGRALAQPDRFEPASVERVFRLMAPDLFDMLVIPALLERIRSEAPGIELGVVATSGRDLPQQLETGELDLAIVPQVDQVQLDHEPAASGLLRQTLFRDRFVCLLRNGHPALARKGGRRGGQPREGLPLETYVALSHAMVSPTGSGPGLVDRVLEARGLKRRIALRVPLFHTALTIVERSDLVLTAPTALARFSQGGAVAVLEPPIPLPEHSVNLVFHERYTKDAGHIWLRTLIIDAARASHEPA